MVPPPSPETAAAGLRDHVRPVLRLFVEQALACACGVGAFDPVSVVAG